MDNPSLMVLGFIRDFVKISILSKLRILGKISKNNGGIKVRRRGF
jgi:hypothetical protein